MDINDYKLYKDIVENGEYMFSSSVDNVNGYLIETFYYNLAPYEKFNNPVKVDFRGTTFLIGDENGCFNEPKVIARPFHKFFNLKEKEFVLSQREITDNGLISTNIENGDVVDSISIKEDGTMIFVLQLPDKTLHCSTKKGVGTMSAKQATQFLDNSEISRYISILFINMGYTPIFEFVGPSNRIVVNYEDDKMILIGCRNIIDGSYMNREELENIAKEHNFLDYLVPNYYLPENFELTDDNLENYIYEQNNFEGVVVNFKDGKKLKVKTKWFKDLHNDVRSIFNTKSLIRQIIDGTIDDILPNISQNDNSLLEKVQYWMDKIIPDYNERLNDIESFFEINKTLSYEDYLNKSKGTSNEEMKNLRYETFYNIRRKKYDFKKYMYDIWRIIVDEEKKQMFENM